MLRGLNIRRETWPLASPFRISRGTKLAAEVVVVEIRQGDAIGRGESVPYAHYGETVDSVLAEVQAIANDLAEGSSRGDLSRLMSPGAARNAIDCALWDLSAKLSGESVEAQLGCGPLPALTSALTVSLDTPEKMQAAAAAIAGSPLIKIKVDGTHPEAQLAAVRRAAPHARLIVDPNESWSLKLLEAMQPALVAARVDLVEQPLPAADDALLEGFRPACNICADESCHVAEDLPNLKGRFQAVNIKLDKTGGLTAALQLYAAARAEGFQIMVGCMICTSLGIAPAYHIARHADFVDLDGPLWLKKDHAQGVRLERGLLLPPDASFWGAV
jgi:L-alanine-DL-glutamate epimerase-like enolase superfamily enzyme